MRRVAFRVHGGRCLVLRSSSGAKGRARRDRRALLFPAPLDTVYQLCSCAVRFH